MQYTVSLNKNSLFKRLYHRGNKCVSDCLVMYYLKTGGTTNRLGFTVSKKVGNAVVRNRVRRLIYENYRLQEARLKKGYDICFVARSSAALCDFHQIKRALNYLLSRSKLYSNGSGGA